MQKPLTEDIYAELKRRILNHEYSANDVLTERGIAAEFNVSKTPVRETLSLLCQEGDLMRYPGFGYVVKELSYTDALFIAEMRCVLESAAVRLIVAHATDEEIRDLYEIINSDEESDTIGVGKNTTFHWTLGKLSKNPYMAKEIRQLAMSTLRPSTVYIRNTFNRELHEQIVDALLERDADKAVRCLRQDITVRGQREV